MHIPDDALPLAREQAVAGPAFDRLAADPGQDQATAQNSLQFIAEFVACVCDRGAGPDAETMLVGIAAMIEAPGRAWAQGK